MWSSQQPLWMKHWKYLLKTESPVFPVIDDDWKLVGLVSDYDLLALDTISGRGQADTNLFPEVDSTWKTFNEVQKLLSKTKGKLVGDLMTAAPIVVRETTNLEDAARLLLETKYRRLPVVDAGGKLVGIITRGNVVRAALQIKQSIETKA
ncbi:CBS domain-containing protein CBSX1, chloroplastic [Quillaja saponaria]|uniref:CBS domain-containing protein CBSX1, chloroplastic n=1 Tax=Quillaja saponaria TaxID=32244 RepID=A0AAD7P545_QUISA|nr:CBS domain-containing protein CBSX1, chloroplastic [Quillaja saponaria]